MRGSCRPIASPFLSAPQGFSAVDVWHTSCFDCPIPLSNALILKRSPGTVVEPLHRTPKDRVLGPNIAHPFGRRFTARRESIGRCTFVR